MNDLLGLLLIVHIAGGALAIPTGALAVTAGKGGRIHKLAGTWFFGSMLVLGVTAAILEPFRMPEPGSPIVGLFVCYFILTSWVTARRRDGTTGWFEAVACVVALGIAAATAWDGITGRSPTPVGPGPHFAVAGVCLVAGLLDLRVVLRKRLTAGERIRRHLWRMCLAFFIATGSFFIGQQDVLPEAVRGSPMLFVLGFAPLAIMAFWLVRMRFGKALARLKFRADPVPA